MRKVGSPTKKVNIIFISGIAIVSILTIFVCWFYYVFLNSLLFGNDAQKTGPIGDSLGGFSTPIIGIGAAILTFLAFWVQFKANKQQQEDLKIERFETKFYEMLRIHRDNVDQIGINNNIEGRKTFSRLFNELKYTYYYCLNNINEQQKNSTTKLAIEKIYNISYLIFFFGIGQTSSKLVDDILDNESKPVFEKLAECINKTQDFYRRRTRPLSLKAKVSENESIRFFYDYVPFQGHMGNLSHYVRHIFQLVKFVEERYPISADIKAKNDYIATLRSQLSTYEQAFLYYNALSVLGRPWLESEKSEGGLLKKYPIIKSLPKPLADFYKTPDEIFGTAEKNDDENILFEWTEIKKRYTNIDKEKITS